MLLRGLGGLGSVLLVVLALVAHQLGWVEGAVLARAGAALALVVALLGVVRLPWDLVFEARGVRARQESSRRRGIAVDEAEVVFARRSEARALGLAITVHALGAVLAAAGRGVLGDELGTLLAGAVVGSMAVRPLHAFYVHTRTRLSRAARDAEVPPPDAISLEERLHATSERIAALEAEREAHREAVSERIAVLEARAREDASAWRRADAVTDDKLERVLRELERTVEKTTQSAEVLAGIRAFVRLIRES